MPYNSQEFDLASDISNKIAKHFSGIRTMPTEDLLKEANSQIFTLQEKIASLESALRIKRITDGELREDLTGVMGCVQAWLDPKPHQATEVFKTMTTVKDRLEQIVEKLYAGS